jgi:hypothetical protein
MKGELTYMKLDKKIMKYAIEMFLELQEYIKDDGCHYTLMVKAMYGCIQACVLYALIRKFL